MAQNTTISSSSAYSLLEMVPRAMEYERERAPQVISVLACLLERAVARNEEMGVELPVSVSLFSGLRAPPITIRSYLERIYKYANCSPACFVAAYAYLDRLIAFHHGFFPITLLNVHRLLISSVMVAAKFLDDIYYNNAFYAKVGGVSTQEMNRLEVEFLFRMGFRLHIPLTLFDRYCSHLERELLTLNFRHPTIIPPQMLIQRALEFHSSLINVDPPSPSPIPSPSSSVEDIIDDHSSQKQALETMTRCNYVGV